MIRRRIDHPNSSHSFDFASKRHFEFPSCRFRVLPIHGHVQLVQLWQVWVPLHGLPHLAECAQPQAHLPVYAPPRRPLPAAMVAELGRAPGPFHANALPVPGPEQKIQTVNKKGSNGRKLWTGLPTGSTTWTASRAIIDKDWLPLNKV